MLFALEEAPGAEAVRKRKLQEKAAKEQIKQNEYAILFSTAENRKKTIVWISSRIFYMFGYYAAITWLPNYVQTEVGVNLKAAGWFTAVNYMAMIVGTVVGGYVSDSKLGRKKSYVVITVLLGCMAPVVAFGSNPTTILPIMLTWGFLYGLPTGSSATFMGESWPAEIRGTAVGFTYNCGRIGSWLAPIVVGYFIDLGMAGVGIATVGIGYVLSALILVPFVKEKEYDMSK